MLHEPKRFNVSHWVDDAALVDLPDGRDLLVLSVRADGLHRLEETDVVVPDGEREDVQTHLVEREVVGLGHLLPET